MKIAFNLWTLKNKQQREGMGWYITHTLNYFLKNYQQVEFIFFTTRDFDTEEFAALNVKIVKIFPNKRHPVLYIPFLHYLLPFHLRKIKPNLLVNCDGMSCLYTKTPQLPIIYDIHFLHLPKDVKWYNRWYYNRYFPLYARSAERIATISEFSRKDIAEHYLVAESKIDITYCGVNDYFMQDLPMPQPFRFHEIIAGKPYFFFIGSLNPRKNIARLIDAFSKFREEGGDAKLVLGGAKGWLMDAMDAAYTASKYKSDIIFLGRVADNEVKPLLQHALALTYVPYYEGFGIPLLEAMICSVPVITSNVTSLPEIAGDAAIYVNPYEVDSITAGLHKMYSDKNLRMELILRGSERYKLFTWERTALLLWESITKSVLQSQRKQ